MAKSKILLKAVAKPANDDPPARPRTAAGDRGLLRRFRLGRMLFGAGSDDDPSSRRGSQHLFRTNSVQAPAPDVPHMPVPPQPVFDSPHDVHMLSLRPRPPMRAGVESTADARKSHYSMMSRRSSAPDVAELARRLSRHVEEDMPEFASTRADTPTSTSMFSQRSPPLASALPSHAHRDLDGPDRDSVSFRWQHQQQHAADANRARPSGDGPAHADAIEQDDCVFIPLSSAARNRPSPVLANAAVEYGRCPAASVNAAPGELHNGALPDMSRATMVWKEPRPASLKTQSTSMTSPSLPDSLPLPPDGPLERVSSSEGLSDATDQQETASTRHSSESSATQPAPQPLR
ncbi:hypothetical protein IWW50_006357, partial [Coemansia erecta]